MNLSFKSGGKAKKPTLAAPRKQLLDNDSSSDEDCGKPPQQSQTRHQEQEISNALAEAPNIFDYDASLASTQASRAHAQALKKGRIDASTGFGSFILISKEGERPGIYQGSNPAHLNGNRNEACKSLFSRARASASEAGPGGGY